MNSAIEIVCETPRLVLRKFRNSDADAIYRFRGDPKVMRFSPHGPETSEGVQECSSSCATRYARDGLGRWAVMRRKDEICIGECEYGVLEAGLSRLISIIDALWHLSVWRRRWA